MMFYGGVACVTKEVRSLLRQVYDGQEQHYKLQVKSSEWGKVDGMMIRQGGRHLRTRNSHCSSKLGQIRTAVMSSTTTSFDCHLIFAFATSFSTAVCASSGGYFATSCTA